MSNPTWRSRDTRPSALQALMRYLPVDLLATYVAVTATIGDDHHRAQFFAVVAFVVRTRAIVWVVYAGRRAPRRPLPAAPRTWPRWEMAAAATAFEEALQRLTTENTTLKQRVGQLTADNRTLDERLKAAGSNPRFQDRRIAELENRRPGNHDMTAEPNQPPPPPPR